ncbi:MAG: hypothetical protein HC803_11760 [Saprospiraceae bacterium]|nr:hypothetical protein [Saprospiraceae bacterium]
MGSEGFFRCFQIPIHKKYQIKNKEIQEYGNFKVVDQGQNLIAGYSNDKHKIFSNFPVIVFGDHTTVLKYVDFDFVVGADGTKLLSNKEGDLLYLYYYLVENNIEQEGYKRHFSILKQISVMLPELPEQQKIAKFLSSIDKRIASVSEEVEGMEGFKKGLLQGMFV